MSEVSLTDLLLQHTSGTLKPMVIVLHKDGFSLTLPGANCVDVTTQTFQYGESELLSCVFDGRIPNFLLDVFYSSPAAMFHRGWMLAKIVDERNQSEQPIKPVLDSSGDDPPPTFDMETGPSTSEPSVQEGSSHMKWIALRPTLQTHMTDLNRLILTEGQHLTPAEQLQLESAFWRLVNSAPGKEESTDALDCSQEPSTSTGICASGRDITLPVSDRKRRLAELTVEQEFKLAKIVTSSLAENLKYPLPALSPNENVPAASSSSVGMDSQGPEQSAAENGLTSTDSAVQRFSDLQELPYLDPDTIASMRLQRESEVPVTIFAEGFKLLEEYTIETETPLVKSSFKPKEVSCILKTLTKVALLENIRDHTTYGDITVRSALLDLDPAVVGSPPSRCVDDKAITSRFFLGTHRDAEMYISQYLDMVTEGGKKQLKIAKCVPGKEPQFLTCPLPESDFLV